MPSDSKSFSLGRMYSFPRAALANFHRLQAKSYRYLLSHRSEARGLRFRCRQGRTHSEVSPRESFSASSSFWWLRHSLVYGCLTPISASIFFLTFFPSIFKNFLFNWRVIALQCCIGFCCTAT